MADEIAWFVGIDWASQSHQVCLVDARGECLGERAVAHGGAGIEELCDWLIARTGATPEVIGVAIEMTHGPVVEALLERGFCVYGINPKQLDRFRDRFTVAGAKDDRRDAHVLADSLRTDRHAFRRLSNDEPVIVLLREWSRMADELQQERARLASRMREQLWRYYPQMLELADDFAADWFLDLWNQAPTPAKAVRLRETTIERFGQSAPPAPLAGSRGSAHPETEAVVGRARGGRGCERPYPHADRPHQVGQSAAESSAPQAGRTLRPAHPVRGERAGAAMRAARRGDPAIHARARKDHPRRAARRGLATSAPARLSRLTQPFRGGPGDPPERQNLRRCAPLCLQ